MTGDKKMPKILPKDAKFIKIRYFTSDKDGKRVEIPADKLHLAKEIGVRRKPLPIKK